MSAIQQMLFGGGAPFEVGAVHFDDTDGLEYNNVDNLGMSDSKSGIFSGWINPDDESGDAILLNGSSRVHITKTFQGTNAFSLTFTLKDSSDTTRLSMVSASNYDQVDGWMHILASWNVATGAAHLYVNDVSDKGTTSSSDANIDYTDPVWYALTQGGSFAGDAAEFYFAPGQFLDFSVTANRRKFVRQIVKPVQLGADGSVPTGVAPAIYFGIAPGDAAADFALNRGSGNDFSVTGTLSLAATSPSD